MYNSDYKLTVTLKMEEAAKVLISAYEQLQAAGTTSSTALEYASQQRRSNSAYLAALSSFRAAVDDANPDLALKIQTRQLPGSILNDFLAEIAKAEGKAAPSPYGSARSK
jgi:hypothetical protein